ncbi:serine palmitoyltransferase 1-like isoform X2 [Portunus trituberculatus]|uniref:serine palmitoyltransferase 1-like isoform X2 n=1 Tax=Portunus trituberculatus TaxID=210409 RepID=UPI001E1D0B1A|nr:serine palmitoyltransferase 1-like isoform X2 [Portunus trituberculatus]
MASQWNVYESFQALLQAGPYHLALEGVLVACILWLFTAKKKPSKSVRLTLKEEEELLMDWNPEPLVLHPPPDDHPSLHPRTVYGKLSKYTDIGIGTPLLNLSTQSFLGLGEREEVLEGALSCLHQYGVGSCGPRGFYGTTEVHLQLEDRLARFFNTEAAILYAYGFSTSASAIPAYAKNGDIIYADEMVNFALQRGLQASRSRIVYFRHNDVDHLEKLLKVQEVEDAKDPKRANATRKFIVAEGIYLNTGTLCNLAGLVALRQRYKLRLFLDESVSFGTLGPHCRGATDHFNVQIKEVDLLMGTLEGACGGAGGFCVGTNFVVEHQRLSGLGYCFSASLPPMLAAASIKVIDVFEREGPDLVEGLQRTCTHTHNALKAALPKTVDVEGAAISPIKHLRLTQSSEEEEEEAILRKVVEEAQQEGVALTVAAYLRQQERRPPRPSIRVSVSANLTETEIDRAASAIAKAFERVLG